ncbi:MAG TPA: cytochrome o ubiquinol oxidase subunit IV [Candidatus Paceibacterota bacterium]|nr:cytochrome o ubiquinol oxidase subunit IV [Candidatus Paceibacterota bacterium]
MDTLKTYVIGFGLSVAATLFAFGLVERHTLSGHAVAPQAWLVPLLVLLAVAQLATQLICFLHVGKEERPRWNLMALLFALLIVAILVGGTLWIMNNLDHMLGMGHGIPFSGEVTPQTEDD